MRTSHLADDVTRAPATETSPLLATQAVNDSLNGPSAGIAKSIGQRKPDEETAGGNGIDDARIAQFKGEPELQKRLKYIVPAITIGVSRENAPSSHIISTPINEPYL